MAHPHNWTAESETILCWEQRNHNDDTWANGTGQLRWPPSEIRSPIIVLQATDWFATD